RHRGVEDVSTSPATPPGMRVRTGRFAGLRLADKSGNSQLIEEAVRQRDVKRHRRVVPPPPAVGSDFAGGAGGHPAGYQLAIDDPASLPVLELHGAETVTNPPVEVVKHARGLREPEVSLPSREVASERLAHLRETSAGIALGQLPHALLHAFDGLG